MAPVVAAVDTLGREVPAYNVTFAREGRRRALQTHMIWPKESRVSESESLFTPYVVTDEAQWPKSAICTRPSLLRSRLLGFMLL
jgi:hypothetical protein